MITTKILSTGSYLPKKIVTNDELAKTVDTSDEWIVARTGIKQRHIASDSEPTSYMAARAAENALLKHSIAKDDIDLIIVATTTPDKTFPSTAALVQKSLDIKKATSFDVQAVCSGFIYALNIANNMMKSGNYRNSLVIGAEKMSSIVNWQDRSTCVLFGDGAGAVVLSADTKASTSGLIESEIHTEASLADILYTDGGVATTRNSGCIVMRGREVFKHGVEKMSASMLTVAKKAQLSLSDISWFVPHQANYRMIEAIAKKLGITATNKFIITLDKHANTSAASIPLALDSASNRFSQGDNIMLTAAGGGFTWGSFLLKY